MSSGLAEKITESEAEIMKVVWDAGAPITYKEIRSTLMQQTKWEGGTVNTLVNRLVKKGVLQQEKRDVYYYTPAVAEDEYISLKTQSLVEKVYGGNVKHLLNTLLKDRTISADDLEDLKDFWRGGGKK